MMDSYSGYRFQGLRGREQHRERERGVQGAEHFHKLMTAIVGSFKWRNKLTSGEVEDFFFFFSKRAKACLSLIPLLKCSR